MDKEAFLETYRQVRENLILILRKGQLEAGSEVLPDWGTLMFFIDLEDVETRGAHFQVQGDGGVIMAGYVPIDILFYSYDDIAAADTFTLGGDDD